jgi:glycosyltransferase involved in cell wall biosynthesis
MKKIILATGIFPPDIGGPATYTQRLAEELVRKGIIVKVITYADANALKFQIPNSKLQTNSKSQISIIRISRKYPKGLRHFLYFLSLLKLARDADVIYAQNLISAGLPSFFVSQILRKKFIVKIVGDAAWENYASKNKKFDNLETFQKKKYDFFTEFLRIIQKFVAKGAEKIITPSQYLKNIISNWGINKEKIEVIYNAVEKINFDISKDEAKKKIGIEGNIILSIGRLVPWKGFSALIEIMPDLLKENPNFKLIIVGEGEEKENLKFKIENLKLENNVKLIGKIIHPEIPFYFKAADFFVLNSEYEGLSHVILEAMQFGVPVIASNKGGNPELVEDGKNGFLVEYNNKEKIKEAILKLWRDKSLQEKFIQNSKEKLKEFNWENLVEKTLSVLKS